MVKVVLQLLLLKIEIIKKVDLKLEFIISLHEKDKALLEEIKIYFRVGDIYKQGAKSIQFIVQSVKDLQVIINHFDKYPLITQKKEWFFKKTSI